MLKELARFINEEEQQDQRQDDPKLKQLIQKCKDLPFYRWTKLGTSKRLTRQMHDSTQFIEWKSCAQNNYKSSCCWDHLVPGLPVKSQKIHPLYDYEKMLFNALEIGNYLNAAPGVVDRTGTGG